MTRLVRLGGSCHGSPVRHDYYYYYYFIKKKEMRLLLLLAEQKKKKKNPNFFSFSFKSSTPPPLLLLLLLPVSLLRRRPCRPRSPTVSPMCPSLLTPLVGRSLCPSRTRSSSGPGLRSPRLSPVVTRRAWRSEPPRCPRAPARAQNPAACSRRWRLGARGVVWALVPLQHLLQYLQQAGDIFDGFCDLIVDLILF